MEQLLEEELFLVDGGNNIEVNRTYVDFDDILELRTFSILPFL